MSDNLKIRTTLKQLALLAICLIFSSCQTIDLSEKAQMQRQLKTQRSIIVNYLNKGRAARALKLSKRLSIENPKDADLQNLLGLSYLALNAPQEAIEALEKAYKLKPVATVALNLSSAFIEAKQYNQATKALMRLKKSNPESFKIYDYQERIFHNLGLSAEKRGKLISAEKFYKQGLKINPNFYLSTLQLAELYSKRDQRKIAFKYFRTANRICGSCYEPIVGMLTILQRENRHKLAGRILQNYLNRRDVAKINRKRARSLGQKLALAPTNRKRL